MSDSNALPRGVYRHYKGQLYELVDVARHSETEELMAVYRTLYGDRSLWVRPLAMFQDRVEIDGRLMARFSYVAETED